MKIAAIVRTNLLRTMRDRLALFFSILLPLILILVLGLTFGAGASVRIGVVNLDGGPLAADLVTAVSPVPGIPVDLRTYDSPDALRDDVSRGVVSVAIVIPAGYSDSLAAGERAEVTVLTPPTQRASAVRTAVDEAVARENGVVRAAQFAAASTGQSFADALAGVRTQTASVAGVGVSIVPVNATTSGAGGYGAGAQGQLVLFMFLTSLTGSVELVISRQLGISRRMFATPTGPWTIIGGESLARIVFAILQGLFIVGASAILFGVGWGDPVAVAAILVVYALVAGGASMIVGSYASTPSQAGALGPALGLVLALLGGAMVPLEVFPPAMQTVARLTPHAWAMDALAAVVNAGEGVGSVLPQLAVLLAFAGLFFAIAVHRFRRVLVGAA
jgi:ABC-2 type transport system permease protein